MNSLLATPLCFHLAALGAPDDGKAWLRSTAHAIPKETTSEGSGYFSIIEGKNGRIYVGTAKYRENAYLVEFDPATKSMKMVVDAMAEIRRAFPDRPDGFAKGFAAQAKIHTRNNTGESGKIYFATKQGYPKEGETREDYLGGYPMVYDPAVGSTRVYDIPVPRQGVIGITPDESRGVAYISTCSDERPVESSHFLILDLASGKYRDILDCRHMYAFIVLDHRGRSYHPILGGEIARYDPSADRLEKLKQTIDGGPPAADSLLAHPESHPINWDATRDGRTLYAVAMSGNQLYSYRLDGDGAALAGKSHGKLLPKAKGTDCRAMCVGPKGTAWAAVTGSYDDEKEAALHLVSYAAGDTAPKDHGPIAVANPAYTEFIDPEGKPLPFHHGIKKRSDGVTVPLYPMGVCEARDGTLYVIVIDPYTLLEMKPGRD